MAHSIGIRIRQETSVNPRSVWAGRTGRRFCFLSTRAFCSVPCWSSSPGLSLICRHGRFTTPHSGGAQGNGPSHDERRRSHYTIHSTQPHLPLPLPLPPPPPPSLDPGCSPTACSAAAEECISTRASPTPPGLSLTRWSVPPPTP